MIIGDEMGLGKTVQALAAMAHLSAAEARTNGSGAAGHFLVVCPASVLVNWTREIGKHTTLAAHSLHGDDRERARQEWLGRGGVAVTTYEALRAMPVPEGLRLAMMTVDEAHYAKNPRTLRTKAVRGGRGDRARPVPHRHPDGEPGRGVPRPGRPPEARRRQDRQGR